MNLLKETLEDIKRSGHKPDDIVFIGSEESGHSCTWDEFTKMSDVVYDSGYGAPKVAQDLIIVFSDGVKMWRSEYDGSEEWEYSTPFKAPKETKPISRLIIKQDQIGWETLESINHV